MNYLGDESFYLERINNDIILKKNHPCGYYTQIQMAMGLAGASFCDLVVYTFKELLLQGRILITLLILL